MLTVERNVLYMFMLSFMFAIVLYVVFFEQKQISMGFLLFVYICIDDGNPIQLSRGWGVGWNQISRFSSDRVVCLPQTTRIQISMDLCCVLIQTMIREVAACLDDFLVVLLTIEFVFCLVRLFSLTYIVVCVSISPALMHKCVFIDKTY